MFDLLFNDSAAWFTIPAIFGTFVFIVRLVLMLAGGHSDIGDVHADAGGHHGDSGEAFQLLSVQSIAAFLMGFGWGGLGGLRGAGWDWTTSLLIGLAAGVGMVWLLALLLKAVFDLQSSGNIAMDRALGAQGDVYVTVPARNSGSGQVRIVINDRQRIYNAVTAGEAIPTNTRVRVESVNDNRTLTVVAV
jgi:hypothetical protein